MEGSAGVQRAAARKMNKILREFRKRGQKSAVTFASFCVKTYFLRKHDKRRLMQDPFQL